MLGGIVRILGFIVSVVETVTVFFSGEVSWFTLNFDSQTVYYFLGADIHLKDSNMNKKMVSLFLIFFINLLLETIAQNPYRFKCMVWKILL